MLVEQQKEQIKLLVEAAIMRSEAGARMAHPPIAAAELHKLAGHSGQRSYQKCSGASMVLQKNAAAPSSSSSSAASSCSNSQSIPTAAQGDFCILGRSSSCIFGRNDSCILEELLGNGSASSANWFNLEGEPFGRAMLTDIYS